MYIYTAPLARSIGNKTLYTAAIAATKKGYR